MIEVAVRSVTSRRRGRLKILTATVYDDTDSIKATWFNQPWLEKRLEPGTQLRLRGRANRYGFAVSSYDLDGEIETAAFAPVYSATEDLAQKRLRELRAQVLGGVRDVGEPLPAALRTQAALPLRADALAVVHRPRDLREAETGRLRLAFDELLVLQLALARSSAVRERAVADPLPRSRRADRPLPRRASVRAHERPGEGDRRSRARPRAPAPDAATPPGRRQRGQDGRRALRSAPRRRGGPAGSAHGSDGDAGRAALPHDRGALLGPRRPRLPAHELSSPPRARGRAAAHRVGRRAARRRHARPHPEGGRLPRPRGRGGGRAAPLRSRPAERARRGAESARPAHDGDTDPEDTCIDALRRPRGERARHPARGAEADRDEVDPRGARVGGLHPAHATAA